MIGPAASDWAGVGFAAADSAPPSHPASGPFKRPTASPTRPAATTAHTTKNILNGRLITNLLPDVPSLGIFSEALGPRRMGWRLRASPDQAPLNHRDCVSSQSPSSRMRHLRSRAALVAPCVSTFISLHRAGRERIT